MLKLGFLLAVLLGVLVPLVAWAERKQLALMEGRVGPSPEVFGVAAGGLLHPLAEGLRVLATEWVPAPRGKRAPQTAGAVVAFSSALLAWSVVPFGGVYAFGETTLSLVVADIDWGFLLVAVAAGLTGLGVLLAGGSALATSRVASFTLVGSACVGLALLGLAVSFATLRPVDIVLAQDEAFSLAGVIGVLSASPPSATWSSWLQLPAWGVVLQPLGFVAFTFGLAMLLSGGSGSAGVPGGQHGLLRISHRIWLLGAAAWVTTLYLGGWAIPFLPTETLISFVAGGFGTGFATGFVLLLHILTFLAKLVAVVAFLILVSGSHPMPRPDQAMALGTGLILPLATLNVLLTAVAVGAFAGAAG